MKSLKVSFDLSDAPKLVELMRVCSAKKGITQKALLIEALQHYFGREQEDQFLKSVADKAFAEWNNPEDSIYDTL